MLVLFDVDGTLLTGSTATHVAALADGVEAVTGSRPDCSVTDAGPRVGDLPLAGMVDQQILALMVTSVAARPTTALLRAAAGHAGVAYRNRVRDGGPTGNLQPGVPHLLAALRERGARLGLQTGNLSAIARTKLSTGGLWLQFSCGGFGNSAASRADMMAEAVAFARPGELVWAVGDTPADIAAAHAHRVPAVGVATGWHPANALHAAGADYVAASLAQPELSGVLTSPPPPR